MTQLLRRYNAKNIMQESNQLLVENTFNENTMTIA